MDLINRTTDVPALKASLDASATRMRGIADRVARASAGGSAFALPDEGAAQGTTKQEPVDLEQEMADLADTQLRFETAARLLQKTYAALRASLRDK
jgi:flagellar basal body rod protein FlgB